MIGLTKSKSQIFTLANFETENSLLKFWLSIFFYNFIAFFWLQKIQYMSKGNSFHSYNQRGKNSILWLKGALCMLVLGSSIFRGGHSYKFSKDSNVWNWYYPNPYPP